MTHSRKQCTSGDRCQTSTLQEAIYCLLHHSAVPLAKGAAILGVRPGYLMDAGNPDREETQFQARLVAATCDVFDNNAVIVQLARDCGGVYVALPKISEENVDVLQHAGKAVKEFSDVLNASASMLADGKVTAAEAAEFATQADEAIAAIAQFKQLMRAKAGLSLAKGA